jgi:hypothetical protein
MVDAAAIINRLIQLVSVREKNRERFFNNFIEPLYRDGESAAKDYMSLLAEFFHRIETATAVAELTSFLKERRTAYQPVRMKIRAFLKNPALQNSGGAKSLDSIDQFADGLWGIMRGGALLIAESEDYRAFAQGRDDYRAALGIQHHRILIFLDEMSHYLWKPDTITDERRQLLLERVKIQQVQIERSWEDVVRSYAELKRKSLR